MDGRIGKGKLNKAVLEKTAYAEFLLSIKEIGVAALAVYLGELEVPTRWELIGQAYG